MDSATKQFLEQAMEKMGEAMARLSATTAIALIEKGLLTSDKILAKYRSPSGLNMLESGSHEFERMVRQAQKDYDRTKNESL